MTDHRGPIPVPARITIALKGAFGPQVDIDLGGVEPMVDEWENGTRSPTPEQVKRLAAYTGFPEAWFYAPAEELGGPMRLFICDRGRRGNNGLTIVKTHIDWAGVLHAEQETPDRPPRRKPPAKPAAQKPAAGSSKTRHDPQEDPTAPGCCQVCGLPVNKPNARHNVRR